jgi:hypothetical protein
VDYYRYRTGSREQRFPPEQVIHFRYPDPRDPYTGALSPLRAAFEQVALLSDYAAFEKAKFESHGVADALVTPDELIGEEERDRLETQWNQRFRRGGSGRVVVAESALKVQLLQQNMGDLAAVGEMDATKELIANAFRCPIAFFTTQTNLANLLASQSQHMDQAEYPPGAAGREAQRPAHPARRPQRPLVPGERGPGAGGRAAQRPEAGPRPQLLHRERQRGAIRARTAAGPRPLGQRALAHATLGAHARAAFATRRTGAAAPQRQLR